MTQGLFHILIIALSLALAIPLGRYIARVFTGERTILTPLAAPVERAIYRLCRIEPDAEMTWKSYLFAFLGFNLVGFAYFFLILVLQGKLPLNPQQVSSLRWDSALSTAVGFITTTNWQPYVGERDLSYFSQMMGVTVMDLVAPALGLVCAIALARGFARRESGTIGNFWVDMTRAILYVYLPLAIPFAIIYITQGTIQNFAPYTPVETLEGGQQLIPGGPAASVSALKLLGENGGGFFGANSAHPFETPTGLMYAFELFSVLLVPASLPFVMGRMLHNRKFGWALFSVMAILFALTAPLYLYAETQGNPNLAQLGVADGVNMEGKDVRFTVFENVLFMATTMPPGNGSTVTGPSSLLPLTLFAIIIHLVNGAPVFGPWGTGVVTVVFYFILTMFVAGLLTARAPEMAGKKLEPLDTILATAAIFFSSFPILVLTAFAVSLPAGLAGLTNTGPHGFTEIFYNCASATVNNGSAAAGLAYDTPFYNLTLTAGMIMGRYASLVVALIVAGSIARKKAAPITAGTLPATSPIIIGMAIMLIIAGTLTFFPALMLGPILEQLLMNLGITF